MIKNIQRTWFEVWGSETAQNQLLKGLLALLIALLIVQTAALVMLSLRKPFIIALSNTETRVLTPDSPHPELLQSEIRRIITAYVSSRHNWDADQIEARIREASRYVDSGFEKVFRKAVSEQITIAKEKKISQVFHVSGIKVDLDSKTAHVSGDRILIIDGLRATNPMSLEIQFSLNTRSTSNPEGIYVTSEKLDTSP